MLPGTHLLIDGKNILYRAIFVRSKDSPVEIFFRIILSSVRKCNATSYHIFWDCPRTDTWRRQVLPSYKANRDEKSDPAIGEAIGKNLDILKKICPELGFISYYSPKLEADDLIYAFASLYHPTDIVVLSSDSDLLQIPFRFLNTRQLKPGKSKPGEENFCPKPTFNPIIQKCLMGDKSDNIEGYYGIGKVKGAKLAQDPKALQEFVAANPRIYLLNQNIVDLGMCPYQMRAQFTILNSIHTVPKFNLNGARGILSQYNMYPSLHELDWSAFHENTQWQST